MDPRQRVWLRSERGVQVTAVVPPAAWRGQGGCVVGPFSSAQCARVFLVLRPPASGRPRVFPAGAAYYVEMPA